MSELVYPDSATAQLATINSDVSVVTSIDASNRAGAIKLFNATADAEPLNEHLGEILYVTDYVMEPITVTNEETGEVTTAIRTVLIDKDGVADHPRVGGEHLDRPAHDQRGPGSSPRWRGARSYPQVGRVPTWDHPRVGGEHTC